jgi:serine protease Do
MTRRRPHSHLIPTLAALAALSILGVPAARAGWFVPTLKPVLLAAFDKPAPDDLTDLKVMEQQVQKVVEKVLPCTVNVRDGGGQGSGVIVSADGYVLTAGHVSREAGRVVDVTLNDGRKVKARTLGANHNIDSGLLKIIDNGKWPFAEMGHSADLKPGQWVVTTGHPGGYNPTRGTVVRLGRVLRSASDFVRTDCTIVGGDSGGPLFDIDGKVVGIHSRIGAPLSANIHVPVDTYRATWDRLTKGDVWGNGFLGFSADRKADGCKVSEIAKDSPAAKAGLEVGDVVVGFGGKKVGSIKDLGELLRDANVGSSVVLDVEREDGVTKVTVTIGKREGNRLPDALGQIKDEAYKTSTKVLSAFRAVEDKARNSTVKVLCDGKEAALGTVVGADGYVLTKNSELKGKLICKLPGGQEAKATIVGVDDSFDLAMLKVEAKGLVPVQWDESKLAPVGHWLASAGTTERPVGIGVVSVATRKGSRDLTRSGYLGILLAEAEGGVKISEVMPDTAAAKAGLKANDIVVALGGKAVKDVPNFIEEVGQHKPGEEVTLRVKRGDVEKEIKATLGKRPPEASRADIQNTMGGPLSTRRAGFPTFLQHDTVLKPTECGGPVIDLDGRAVGVNIARAGRVESYAIPSEVLRPLLPALMSGKLAPPPEKSAADKVAEARAAVKKAEEAKTAAEKKLADPKLVDKKAAEAEKTAAEKKLDEARAALEKAEAELKKEPKPSK